MLQCQREALFLSDRKVVLRNTNLGGRHDSSLQEDGMLCAGSLEAEPMAEKGAWRAYEAPPAEPGQCHRVQAAHNFFMARTDTLLRYQWHHKMSIFEHEHFFFQLYLAKQVILSCPHVSVFHYRAANLHDHK